MKGCIHLSSTDNKRKKKKEKQFDVLPEIIAHDQERTNPPGVHIPPEKEMCPPQLG